MAATWAVLVLAFVALEVYGLFNDVPGDTLSERIREWALRHWTRRLVVLAILAWLSWHWGLL